MDPEIPLGRARGRARGRPVVPSASSVASSTASSAAQSGVAVGRGRALTPDEALRAGRSKPTRISQATGPTRVGLTASMGAMNISSSGSSDSGSKASDDGSNGDGNGSNGNGNGNGSNGSGNGNGHGDGGNGLATSAGRGAKRGKPLETPAVLRTLPVNLASKKGKTGQVVKLKANFFALKKVPNWRLYQYRVDMSPDIDYTKERKYHVRQNKDLKDYFFDGTVLISTHPICVKGQNLTFISKRSSDDEIIQVTIKHVGEVEPHDSQYLQFLNIIIRSLLEKLSLDLIGRNYYDSKAKIVDPKLKKYKLELYPGYVTSIRQHENEVLLGVEISHKILRTDTVYDMIKSVVSQKGASKLTIKDRLEKILLGQIVITKYNNKTYKISEVMMDMTPKSEFEDKKGNKIRFCDYYMSRWNCKITDLDQPLIVSIPKEADARGMTRAPIQLVPELCNMTGLSEEQRSDFNLMKDLGEYTRQGPDKKELALRKFSNRISGTPEVADLLKKWNMEFDSNLQDVLARQFPAEAILGKGNAKADYDIKNASWDNSFRKVKCLSVVQLDKWVIIVPTRDTGLADAIKTELKSIFPGIGMTVKDPMIAAIDDNRMGTYMQALDNWTGKKPQLIMIIIPNNKNPDLYSMIKKKCCVRTPTPSQVVTGSLIAKKKDKGLKSIATKIGLQMNCKVGGQLWTVKIPLPKTMIVGFDTYHDSQQKGKSVGALVASVNDTFTKYFSATEFHDSAGAQEISAKIASMMVKAVNCYEKLNNCVPDRVFFYRDGVGDGQIRFVHDVEVQGIKQALKEYGKDIKLTFIITSKRINTRFMSIMGSKFGNPNSGTVIDDVVTLPERYDFFLVSQSVNQGTVNPTSYNVILDENGLPPDKVQVLTYKLTHLYFNWMGTVRVPAPVQYAHKLAYLVGTSIHQEPSDQLQELLYFL